MASYYEYFEIKVEGNNESIESICDAVRNYAPKSEIACDENKIVVREMYKIKNEDDACEFAETIARASKGANFMAEGETECSVGGDTMKFEITFKDDNLTLRHSDWYYNYSSSMLEDYETYEEYCEDEYEIENEEDFLMIKENEITYCVDGKFLAEVPFVDELQLNH